VIGRCNESVMLLDDVENQGTDLKFLECLLADLEKQPKTPVWRTCCNRTGLPNTAPHVEAASSFPCHGHHLLGFSL
jgi:hypothetical protein